MANVRDQFCDLLKSKPKPPVLLSYDYEKQSAQRRHLVRSSSATAKHCGQVQAVDEEAGADEHQQCSSLSSAAVLTDVDNVTEVEELHGTVVRGRNGQFYVALNSEMNLDNRDDDKIDLEHFGNVFVTVSATDGAQTLVFDDTDRWAIDSGRNGQRLTITGHANSAAVAQCHGMRRTMTQKSVVRSSQQSDDHHYSGDAFTGANADNSANTNDDRGGNEQPKQQHLVPSHSSSATAFDEDVAQEEVIEYEDTAGSYDFKRRSRVFGGCRCFECGQTFVNMARLERHLSVHQQYGLYLCPLCNKTYKYEYNLFFHWRNTCRDMNELLSSEERKSIEINALRQLVEEIAQKKMAIGPLELAVPSVPLRRALPPILRQNAVPPVPQQQHKTVADKTLASKLTMANMFGDKLALCSLCGLTVYNKHLLVHLAVHRGERPVDGRSIGGAFFCNLCGLAFRSRANLIRHWRTGCSTIHANLPTNSDIALDDIGLKQLVVALLKNLTTCKDESEAFGENFEDGVEQPSTSNQHHNFNDYTAKAQHRAESVFESPSQLDEQWAQAEGILFADDFFDDDIPGVVADANNICGSDGTLLLFNSDGRLGEQYKEGAHHYQHQRSRFGFAPHPPPPPALVEQRQRTVPAALVAAVVPSQQHGTQAVRATSAERDGLQWIQYAPQSVQCSECYRSFSSVQRLEKHMASTHCSFGTHHCLLCGSRFKYEYNLLFHYRQVCPYTLKMIDKKMRQQMEATDLKKSVRRIAAATTLSHLPSAGLPHHHGTSALLTQSSASMALSVPTSSSHSTGNNSSSIGRSSSAAMQQLNSSSSTLSNLALLGSTIHDDIAHNGNGRPSTFSLSFAVPCADADEEELESVTSSSSVSASHASVMVSSSRPELGDSVIRRQMMKKIIQKHRRHQQLDSSSANFAPLPHQLLQPTVRPNLPDGTQCPICSIVFYGLKVLVRHLRAAHPNESSVWERTLSALGASTSDGVNNGNLVPILLPASSSSAPATKLFPSRLSTQRKRKIFREDSEEHPPQLELAEHVDSSLQHLDNQDPSSHHIK